ncbi:DUF3467 domain-containing protein [Patescibacteria group bacterium]|nr:DUF3467 domain-containing protein [Patescibacteria group bacterium]
MAEDKSLQLTKQLHVKVPENHIPTFANSVQINVANEEVTLQFIFVRPNTSQGTMVSEIIITPQHAIKLQKALDSTIKQHFTKHI